jgi:transcriptional regulator GlxA family with amidase domain
LAVKIGFDFKVENFSYGEPRKNGMKMGFVIYEGMTGLDFVGVFDPLSRLKTMGFLKNVSWEICAVAEQVTDAAGLLFTPSQVGIPLDRFDIVIVPGGPVAHKLCNDETFLKWFKTMKHCPFKASVCSGSLLLGAAGFLKGKKATTHPTRRVELAEYCTEVVDKRVVDEGTVITAGGVTSAIDLGLYLCEKFAGFDVKEKIRRQMDYYG